jgi:superfamily II DNA helicase RecQ
MSGGIKCIIATICFGMGVNKKNIRYVINVGVSLSA